jgi:predicted dehydrogenase
MRARGYVEFASAEHCIMSSRTKVALAGIAGYGDLYLDPLLHDPRADREIDLVGVVDTAPQHCHQLGELHARGVRIHSTLESLFASSPVELLMIATPIHLHAAHTCTALKHDANVLCEKPLAATLHDAVRMAECERASKGKFVAIGYQWCFSHAVQALKRDIMAGEFGRALRMKSIALFPRGISYFRRNDWAGRIRTAAGEGVLDSPANNATAHYLHNMLYLLGAARERSAMPLTVQAELYRANEIENFDTAAVRVMLASGCELLFYTTLAATDRLGPLCRFEFEHAVVEYDFMTQPQFVARFRDGRVRNYGDPNANRMEKIWQSVDAVRTGAPVACGIPGATPHTVAVVAAQHSTIVPFPEPIRRLHADNGQSMIWVDGLADALVECYECGVLPAEHGKLDWARAAAPVDCAEVAPAGPARSGRVTVSLHARPGIYAS